MEASPATLALLTDKTIRDLTSTALGQRALEINTQFEQHQNLAALHGCAAVNHAIAMGQVFEEAFRRFDGEFADWLRTSVGEATDGSERVSEKTALRYRTLWKKRDMIFPPDGSAPECRTLTEAYIKVGLIPAPTQGEGGASGTAPIYRLTFSTSAIPPEQWTAIERATFLEKTKPVIELREKVAALQEAA